MLGIFELFTILGVDFRLVFRTPAEFYWRDPRNLLDPDLLYIHKPRQHLKGLRYSANIARWWCLPPAHDFSYEMRFDRNGFRNEQDFTKANIALIGDSQVEGFNVRTENLASSLLDRNLGGAAVINLGQAWYGPQQELIVLRRYALPLYPKVIAWVFYEGNDLDDFLRYERVRANREASFTNPHSFSERSFSHNYFLLVKRTFFRCETKPAALRYSGILKDESGKAIRTYFLRDCGPLTSRQNHAYRETLSLIEEAHDLCRKNQTKLIFLFLPSTFRVYSDIAKFAPDSECIRWRLNDLPARFKEAIPGISQDIGFIDLTPLFKQHARKGKLVFFEDDTHLTPLGHELVAQTIQQEFAVSLSK